MIPRAHITAWRSIAPWVPDAQVEQDLVISRALVAIFSHPFLSTELAFRGGTALYKLYIKPPARYSEDIDLVQVNAGPEGPFMHALHESLDPWLGQPTVRRHERKKFLYRFESEDSPPLRLRLKIEINTREHFSVFGLQKFPFAVQSDWFSGDCNILGYSLDELIGTKLRALYQRKKGRDLFDIDVALRHGGANPKRIIEAFRAYLNFESASITRQAFEENLRDKLTDEQFAADVKPLLTADSEWNRDQAAATIFDQLIACLPSQQNP